MKTLLTTLLVLISVSGYGRQTISCDRGELDLALIREIQNDTIFTPMMSITFNFSNASVICPTRMNEALENQKPFQCAGLWSHDIHEAGDTIGTEAILSFKHIADDKWQARFRTSKGYGREVKTMNCLATEKE